MLLQYPNDLLFRVSALLHPSPPVQITRELQFSLAEFLGGRSLQSEPAEAASDTK